MNANELIVLLQSHIDHGRGEIPLRVFSVDGPEAWEITYVVAHTAPDEIILYVVPDVEEGPKVWGVEIPLIRPSSSS